MIYTELTKKAINIAYKAYDGRLDDHDCPYIMQLEYLPEIFCGFYYPDDRTYPSFKKYDHDIIREYLVCIGWLHDIIIDTDITLEKLAKEFPKEIVDAIDILTIKKGMNYSDYIDVVSQNDFAREIKIQELAKNKRNMEDRIRYNGTNLTEHEKQLYDIYSDAIYSLEYTNFVNKRTSYKNEENGDERK